MVAQPSPGIGIHIIWITACLVAALLVLTLTDREKQDFRADARVEFSSGAKPARGLFAEASRRGMDR